MKIEGKRNSIILFLVVVWLPSVVFYMLEATGNFGDWIEASFYVSVTIACLVTLGTVIKSDDGYWRNMGPLNLLFAVIAALAMTILSWGLSIKLENPHLLSVAYTMSFIAAPSSILTTFLSLLLYGLVMAATAEELLKLTMFAELKARYGKHWYGVFIYVGFPVGFWALLHGVQAYNDPLMILPAFINGIVLIIVLWKTKSILTCIFSHFLFNAGVTALTFLQGTASIPAGTPLFPSLSNLTVADIAIFVLLIASLLFFLLPSLRHEKSLRSFQ